VYAEKSLHRPNADVVWVLFFAIEFAGWIEDNRVVLDYQTATVCQPAVRLIVGV
jgi:hypothetical protein